MHTNIEVPDEVANELFRRAPQAGERSALLERILKDYFNTHPGRQTELERINDNADELNREAEDVLDYQVIR